MKIVLALVLIAAAVFRVTESSNTCSEHAAQATNAAGTGYQPCTTQCFTSLSIAVTGGAKSFEKGCVACTAGGTVVKLNADKDKWVKTECCNGDNTADGTLDCNKAVDLTSSTDIGPKCMECDSDDEKCVKGGTAAAAPYVEGTVACNVETSFCSVERKADGTVKRACEATCVDAGKAGEATFKKCCISADFCNNDDATGGDGDKDGAQAVFASYALLFSGLLLAYLK